MAAYEQDGGEMEVLEYPACPDAPPVTAWNGWAEAEGNGEDRRRKAEPRAHAGMHRARRLTSELPRRRADRLRPGASVAARRAARPSARRRLQRLPPKPSGTSGSLPRSRRASQRRARPVSARGGAGGGEAGAGGGGAHPAPRGADGSAAADRRGAGCAGTVGRLVGGATARARSGTRIVEGGHRASAPSGMKPAVTAGEGMRLGDCVIESKVGTVDLGVRSQVGQRSSAASSIAPGQRRCADAVPGVAVAAPDADRDEARA